MARTRVLITVTTYPLPSRSYGELVCTAGILEDGSWVRIYPVPFEFLEFGKYQWVELDLVRREHSQDFRPESYRPSKHNLSDRKIVGRIGTEQSWHERKNACLMRVHTNMTSLIAASNEPDNVSLATFRPTTIKKFIVEADEREWKPEWLEQLKQMDMLTSRGIDPKKPWKPVDKIPYKFKYQFEDDEGRTSTMTIEDWEIGALYRNCLALAEGDEEVAIAKIRQKYEEDFIANKDITLFLGTTLEHHRRRHTNPFTIIGVFYPPRKLQQNLVW